MGGGLMQLVAYGAQDIYLTGNPQITFFKVVYRRHTNFSMESIEQTFNGTADFGRKVTVNVSRNGDLVHKCWLRANLPSLPTGTNTNAVAATPRDSVYINEVGHYLIKSVEVEIGGQKIDKHYGHWLSIWSDLSTPAGKKSQFDANMIGAGNSNVVNVPLQFWFCRHAGLALPLIALQYHEVKFNIEFETLTNIVYAGQNVLGDGVNAENDVITAHTITGSMSDVSMYVDYIYLDTEERRRFAQISHEYLIEQLQFTGDETVSSNSRIKLNFNHPVKELVWVLVDSDAALDNSASDKHNYSAMTSAKLQLNGHDRFSERQRDYFRFVQPYQHHTNIPSKEVNVYSFALKPEEQQPSGSANMSRIDNATLQVAQSGAELIKVFATNYNVLRIMSGMGGLAYSN